MTDEVKLMYCRRDMRSDMGVLSVYYYGKRHPKWYVDAKEYKKMGTEEKKKWTLCELNEDNTFRWQ